MTTLKFAGVVNNRWDDIYIDDKPVIETLGESDLLNKKVAVLIEDRRYVGELYAHTGEAGYSDWTPGWDLMFAVADEELDDVFKEYEGKPIRLWITDELNDAE